MEFAQVWRGFWQQLISAVNTIKPAVYFDWLVVAFLIYHAVRLVRETRAMQLIKGIAAILLVYFFAIQLQMNTLRFVLETIVRSGVLLLAILFQPELRRALEQVGRSKLGGLGGFFAPAASLRRENIEENIRILRESCEYLSERKTGALIVVEREIKLGEAIKTGTVVDAEPSVELIANIFFTNSPLHDGAMVMRNGRVYAAGCYLPLSSNTEIGRELGTRHRAGLGMSEISDAIVIIISEETGFISFASESKLHRNYSARKLEDYLRKKLLPQDEADKKKTRFGRAKK